MTKKKPEVTNELMYKILQQLQGDVAEIKASVRSVKDDIAQLRSELGAMHSHLAAFHTSQAHQRNELAMLDQRIRRVEKRLGLDESEH